jgi:hypothetical protein
MPTPYLATPADLATLTRLSETSPELLLALERASNRFRAAVGHPVHLIEDDTVLLDGDGGITLLLPGTPCTDISVKVDGVTVTDYSISAAAGVLRRTTGAWPDGLGNIEVTFTHGWADIPGAIQDAVLEQAAVQALVPIGVQSESAIGQSVTYGLQSTIGVTQKWTDAVDRYRLGLGGDRLT